MELRFRLRVKRPFVCLVHKTPKFNLFRSGVQLEGTPTDINNSNTVVMQTGLVAYGSGGSLLPLRHGRALSPWVLACARARLAGEEGTTLVPRHHNGMAFWQTMPSLSSERCRSASPCLFFVC